MSDAEIIRPTDLRTEIAVFVGNQTEISLEVDRTGELAPVLFISGPGVQVMLYPHGWNELGEVTASDLDMAGKLVIDVARWRDAIHNKLKTQRAAEPYQPTRRGAI